MIEHIQQILGFASLALYEDRGGVYLSDTPHALKFSHPISQRCDQHFSELIPARTDRDDLYTHVFRTVYATISAHWFCPVKVPEHQFKAEI